MNEPCMRVTLTYGCISDSHLGCIAVHLLSIATISIIYGRNDHATTGLGDLFVLTMLIVREPLLVFWATKITEENQRIDRELEHQKILQVELEEASKRREEMKRKQPGDQGDQIDQALSEDEIKIIESIVQAQILPYITKKSRMGCTHEMLGKFSPLANGVQTQRQRTTYASGYHNLH